MSKESIEKEERGEYFFDHKCPICGKNFIPAPFHVFKIADVLICSWSCLNRARRDGFKRRIHGAPQKKAVLAFYMDGTFIREYQSASLAEVYEPVSAETIRKCCRGQIQSSKGRIYKYKTESGEE